MPPLVAGVIAGAAAMAFTDGTAVALGATDISQWDRFELALRYRSARHVRTRDRFHVRRARRVSAR